MLCLNECLNECHYIWFHKLYFFCICESVGPSSMFLSKVINIGPHMFGNFMCACSSKLYGSMLHDASYKTSPQSSQLTYKCCIEPLWLPNKIVFFFFKYLILSLYVKCLNIYIYFSIVYVLLHVPKF